MENKINYAALSMDEIIFMGRNKDYGAFELRRSYNENVKRAILGTIFFTAFAVSYQSIFARLHLMAEKKKIETVVDLTKIETIEIKTPRLAQPHKEQMPPEPPKGAANAATAAALGEKKPVADSHADPDTIAPPDQDLAIANEAHPGTKGETPGIETGTAPALEMHVAAPAKESEPVSWAQIMPEYPGGEDAMMAFIRNNLRYPAYENEMGIQGKAIVCTESGHAGWPSGQGEIYHTHGLSSGIGLDMRLPHPQTNLLTANSFSPSPRCMERGKFSCR
jgi:protein TonB